MKSSCCFFAVFAALVLDVHSQFIQSDCRRQCDGRPKVCNYYFEVDKFWTMSPDCRNCMNARSPIEADCDRQLCAIGDGRRRMWRGVNGLLPGYPIEVCKGDFVRVRVKNLLSPETTSIHWHGMHQRGTQNMDGVPMVTQRPIQPDEEYLYEFTASESGTHFYHSHLGAQRADGVYGHFIVREPADFNHKSYSEDRSEHVISFLEFFNMTAEEVQFSYMRTKDFYDTYPQSLVINGRGHTPTNNVPTRKFLVQQGRKYRFRMIHAGNIVCPVEFSIDNHDLMVFHSDGHQFEPVTVNSLTITNGERFDFVVNANQAIGEYVMRFEGSLICNVTGYAILKYVGSPTRTSIPYTRTRRFTKRLNCVDHRESGCISYTDLVYSGVQDPLLRGPADVVYHVAFDQFNIYKNRFAGVRSEELFTPLLNNIAFKPPTEVLLCNPYSDVCENHPPVDRCLMGDRPQCDNRTEIYECTHMVTFRGRVVDLVLTDIGRPLTLLHPMHLHGYSYAIVGYRKFGETVDTSTIISQLRSIYSGNPRPIMKDTVGVPDGGTVIIRFVNDNPGFWLFHCHVDFHTEEGMQMVIQTPTVKNCQRSRNCDCTCY